MHKLNRNCPICKQNGKDTPLEIRQINLTEAVYICEDRNCIYPIGFQWEYIKNNVLDDSDESSDDSNKSIISEKKLSCSSFPLIHSDNTFLSNNIHEKPKISNQSVTLSSDSKPSKFNILSNVVIENPGHLQNITKKNNVTINEFFSKPNEIVRRNIVRSCNKAKAQNVSGALPESIIESAKALSEYFSNTNTNSTNEIKKSKRAIKSVFDIIQPTPVKKQDVVKIKKSDEEILPKEDRNSVLINPLIEHNYAMKKVDDYDENKYIKAENATIKVENATNKEEKLDSEITASFDELLLIEDKCDINNQSLDLSEMDELLSFL